MNATASKIAKWRARPDIQVRELFHVEPDPWQDKVLKAFPHENRIAMRACKGPGKTTVESWLILNFLSTRPYPKIAATSITKDNLEDNLWPEIAKWMHRSPFLKKAFQWNKTRIFSRQHPETWFCSARTWPKSADATQQAETLAGLHADYILFVLDEAGGIPDAVLTTAEAALATGKESKLLIGGNPSHLSGPIYRACKTERNLWFVVEITGDPDDPDRATRINKQWAQEQIEKYGRDNPWVLVNVFGQFPPESLNALLGVDDVRKAMKRHLKEDSFQFSQKRLGIDVARFGDDSTILFPRQGLVAFRPVEMKGARTTEIAGRAAKAKIKWNYEQVFIDSTGGHGAGVEDSLMLAGINAIPVSFSQRAIDPRYFNKRAEMWFLMSQWVKKHGALPPDDQLLRELCAPTYLFHNGKLRLEDKDQIKQRLGYSPDRADALALTFALPEMASNVSLPGLNQVGKLQYEYDPIHGDQR